MTRLIIAFAAIALTACVGSYVKDVPMEFTFTFDVPDKRQADILKAARNHFATAYGDSREVFRVEDEAQGLMIGKGVAPWTLALNTCLSPYSIKFGAKDGRAKVQYTLLEGVPPGSPCTGWPLPNQEGYEQVKVHLSGAAQALERALKGTDEFMKF